MRSSNIIKYFSYSFLCLVSAHLSATTLPASWYQEPLSGTTASIRFITSTPYIYKNKHAVNKSQIFIKRVNGTYKNFSAVIYKDAAKCVDFQVFDRTRKPQSYSKISAGKMLTFKMTPFADNGRKNVWCPNRFSFIAEQGKKYTAKIDIVIKNIFNAECRVQLFDDEFPLKPLLIIPRKRFVEYETSRSYRCLPLELQKPEWKKKSIKKFECTLKNGLYGC